MLNRSILVTGSSGFIGSHLVEELSKQKGVDVVGVDIRPSASTSRRADILDTDRIARMMRESNVNCIVHLAAHISVQESVAFPIKYYENNLMGTASVLDAARISGVKSVVFASSIAVYGGQGRMPLTENSSARPESPYGYSKLFAEQMIKSYADLYGLNYTIFRFSNVYGQGQNPAYSGVISKFLECIASDMDPVVYGDGKQTRDFIHVRDVCSGVSRVLRSGADNQTYNLSSGSSTSLSELLKHLGAISRKRLAPVFKAPRQGDVVRSEISNRRFVSRYGWHPKVSLHQGLAALYDAIESKGRLS